MVATNDIAGRTGKSLIIGLEVECSAGAPRYKSQKSTAITTMTAVLLITGGEGGIRTHGTLRYA
jgi:hypothetical protein